MNLLFKDCSFYRLNEMYSTGILVRLTVGNFAIGELKSVNGTDETQLGDPR